jgi:hypothetical protein
MDEPFGGQCPLSAQPSILVQNTVIPRVLAVVKPGLMRLDGCSL